jgi:hypothetical protein
VDDYDDDDFKGILKEIEGRDDFKEIDTVEVRARLLLSTTCGGDYYLLYCFPAALPGQSVCFNLFLCRQMKFIYRSVII